MRRLWVRILFLELGIHRYNINIMFSTSWGSQPYTGGSYTSIGTGGSQTDIETIAEPLYMKYKKKKVVSYEKMYILAFHLVRQNQCICI